MTRSHKIGWLVLTAALLFLLLKLPRLYGQGFGSFSHDQPFLAKTIVLAPLTYSLVVDSPETVAYESSGGSTWKWHAWHFIPTNSFTLTKIAMRVRRQGNGCGLVRVGIFTVESTYTYPNAEIGSSAWIDSNQLSTSVTWTEFSELNVSLTANTRYVIGILAPGSTTSDSILMGYGDYSVDHLGLVSSVTNNPVWSDWAMLGSGERAYYKMWSSP